VFRYDKTLANVAAYGSWLGVCGSLVRSKHNL